MLAAHTTFKTGGPADYYVRPAGDSFEKCAVETIKKAHREQLPLFILGGGANVLAADSGFRGIVLDTTGWTGCFLENSSEKPELVVRAGVKSDAVADFAAENDLTGLEFLAGLPGTIGGAIWMNARCYEKSLSDVLGEVEIIDEDGAPTLVPFNSADYAYKKSPFQTRRNLILSARLRVERGDRAAILAAMETYRKDRTAKGHYSHPSAGSVFKNNHAFGKPTGKIIEELGLRGTAIGGARIADWHGNFIINTGNARSADIYALVRLVQEIASAKLGIFLEPEIIFLGF